MKKLVISSLVAVVLLGAGCRQRNTEGQVVGGIAGGLIGSQFGKGNGRVASAAIGAVIGSVVGCSIQESMDERDHHMMNQSVSQATSSPIGSQIQWSNERSGHRGIVTPLREGKDQQGYTCRDIEQKIEIDGQVEVLNMTVCQHPDGIWRVVH